MASLAESLASVPSANIRLLQQQLLRTHPDEPCASSRVPGPDSDHDHSQTRIARHLDNRDDIEQHSEPSAVIAESADAYPTLRSSPRPPKARLSLTKSAPTVAMEALADTSPSQHAFRTLTRAESFNGYDGGDTQPMDTQVYRDYTESMLRSSTTTPVKTRIQMAKVSPDAREATYSAIDKTPATLGEGDTGFVDLAGAWHPASPSAPSDSSQLADLLASPQTQFQVPELPQRPSVPETPTVGGHKRNRSGETLTSDAAVSKTPGFSQLFGGGAQKGTAMTATQLFNQTQAPSSPMLDNLRSDPIITRPSPNVNDDLSSPFLTASSPIAQAHRALPSSTAGEPRDRYTSMRESQEQRAAKLREELRRAALGEVVQDEDDSQEPMVRPKKIQRTVSDQAFRGQKNFRRAPSRPTSRPSSSRKQPTTIDLVTPATMRKTGRVEFDSISDDEGEEEEEEDAMPMNEDDQDNQSTGVQAEDDVYDELGQTVLRSQRDTLDDDDREEADIVEMPDEDGMGSKYHDQDDRLGDEHELDAHMERPAAHPITTIVATQQSAIPGSPTAATLAVDTGAQSQPNQQSSLTSFIPGSQYAGRTSQEQAQLRASSLRRSTASQPQLSEKIPSSPPLPIASNTLPEGSAEASAARQELLAHFQPRRSLERQDSKGEQEIPESDALTSDAAQPNTAHSTAANMTAAESNSLPAPFSTARTHLSAAHPSPAKKKSALEVSPQKMFASQHSKLSVDSPLRAAGVRKFAEIAADPSQPRGSGESQIDVDALMGDVLTAEDEAFLDLMSSPQAEKPVKRRKLRHRRSRSASRCVSQERSDQEPSASMADKTAPAPPTEDDHPQSSRVADEEVDPEAANVTPQSRPSKAVQPPTSTPSDAGAPQGTQESARRREAAGSSAVSQLLSGHRKKNVKYVKPHAGHSAGKGKKAAAAAAAKEHVADDETHSDLGDQSITHTKDTRKTPRRSSAKLKLKLSNNKRPTNSARQNGYGLNRAASEPDDNLGNPRVTAGGPEVPLSVIDTNEGRPETADHDARPEISASTRVFALFGGAYNHFYPATWLSTSADGSSYKVRFDDTTVTNVDAHQARALDLRVGDKVKVDGPGMRNSVWIVKAFGKVAENEEERALGTDIHDRAWVTVQAKSSARDSLPSLASGVESNSRDVLVTNVYMTHTLWPKFSDRNFVPPDGGAPKNVRESRMATPSTGAGTPAIETPGSRSRRSLATGTKPADARQRASHLREESVASASSRGGSGMFAGMAFAISYISNEGEKADVTRRIERNGGIILERGFDELFELPDFDDTSATPAKRFTKVKQQRTRTPDDTALHLKPAYADLGFVALIADQHSRRAKYMQALALGLPTLSGRWITDCLNSPHHEGPLPWTKYLLPAGESAYLHGAVRSRTLIPYNAAEAKLAETMATCPVLLDGDGVLIVASKKNKAVWERRKTYAFLTLALGAGSVKRVGDLQEARRLSEGEGWRWIYAEGSAVAVEGSVQGGKKRKRGEGKGVGEAKALSAVVGDGVRVVSDEFVVQSLILGDLVD